MIRCSLVFLSAGLAAACAAPEITFDAAPAAVAVFDSAEFTVHVRNTGARNPFTDASLSGVVKDEGGAELRIDGFCDSADGSVHRLRFMPRKAGRHTVALRYAEPGAGDERVLTLTATPPDGPGPVRVDPAYPWHFTREGSGEPWYWNSTTAYQILAWDDATMLRSLERLAGLRVNRVRVALAGRTPGGERWSEPLVQRTEKFAFKMEPWPAARPGIQDDPGFDTARFNLPYWQKVDRLLARARELDVQVSVVFYVDGADKGVDPFGKERAGGPDEQRYYRYAAARLSAWRNVMWDITNEWHLFRTEEWVNRMGTLLREWDPYDHATSVHGSNTFPFRTQPWCDFAMYQAWDESGGHDFMLNNRLQQAEAGRPMPQVNEEYGYEDHYPEWGGNLKPPARNADSRRRLAWGMAFAGASQTTGERADQGTGRGADTGGGWINGRGDASMTMLPLYGRLMDFMTGFEWWKAEPSAGLLRGGMARILAEPGRQYALWLPRGGTATVRIEPGLYSLNRFNPRTGETAALPRVTVGGEDWKTPECPDAGDWAFVLRREM